MKARTRMAFAVAGAAGFAVVTALAHPGSGIVADSQGRIYFTEAGDPDARLPGIIWQIDAGGNLSRWSETGGHWLGLDASRGFPQADLQRWFARRITPWLHRVDTPDAALILADGQPIVFHRDGTLYYAKGNLEVIRLARDGTQTPVAPALKQMAERLGGIRGLAFGPDDSLCISCPSAILKVPSDGTFSTLIHPIPVPDCDREVPPDTPESHLPMVRGLAVDERGNVYAAATGCRALVKITPDGKAAVVMRAEPPWSPTGVAIGGPNVYVLEFQHPHSAQHADWQSRVRKLDGDGGVTTMVTLPGALGRPAPQSPP